MTTVNRSMPRIAALEACAVAERRRELHYAQRQLAKLGESAGLPKDWLDSLATQAAYALPGGTKPSRLRRAG